MEGGGVQKIYMVFLREPSRRDRSGSDLFHLWDGFEIKMNFDRNVSCFIFVNALMHDDFFFLSQPIQSGGKINHIPIRTAAEAVVTPIQLHAWGFIVMERAARDRFIFNTSDI